MDGDGGGGGGSSLLQSSVCLAFVPDPCLGLGPDPGGWTAESSANEVMLGMRSDIKGVHK